MALFNSLVFGGYVFNTDRPTAGKEPNLSYWASKKVFQQGRFELPQAIEKVVSQQINEHKSDDWALKRLAAELELKIAVVRRETAYLELIKAERERQEEDDDAVAIILALAH